MRALFLALALATPASAAPLLSETTLAGSYLADKAVFGEMQYDLSLGSLGVEASGWRLVDRGFHHPLDAFHAALLMTASSRAEGYVLSGMVGASYTRASAAGSTYTGPPAPEVGGRFLWDVSPSWRLHVEGRLDMYEDGYGFVGGLSVQRELGHDLWPFLGWRVFWSTQEGSDDLVKHGVVLGISF